MPKWKKPSKKQTLTEETNPDFQYVKPTIFFRLWVFFIYGVIMNQNNQNKPQQINIELGEKEAEGIYSNLAIITHSGAEFIIDFTRVVPGVPKAKVQSRIITTPIHAKMLLKALKENVDKFEQRFGEIKIDDKPNMPFGFAPVSKDEKVN